MMINEDQKTFSDVIQTLQGEEHISIPLLYRLSDLTPEELTSFCSVWSDIQEDRKRIIIRHLADISEENYQVDFTGIFAHCLTDDTVSVRLSSLDGLWDSDKLHLISPIVELMMNDPEIEVRTLAAATLGHYILMAEWQQIPKQSVTPIVEGLLAVLDDEETPRPVMRAALESIGASSHHRVSSLIEKAYDQGDLGLQVSAVYAMGRSADNRWLMTIIDEMESHLTEMRLEAARAAGALGHSDAVSGVAELLSDEDLEVRLAAVAALGQIGNQISSNILEEIANDPEQSDLREAAQEALEEMDWFGGDIDLSLLDWDNNRENDAFLEV